jgi:hypothetical protein
MLLLPVGTHIMLNLPFCVAFFIFILATSLPFTIEFHYIFVLFAILSLIYIRRVNAVHTIANTNPTLPTSTVFGDH